LAEPIAIVVEEKSDEEIRVIARSFLTEQRYWGFL
jgi:hypothetical protein